MSDTACEWCGRAIEQDAEGRWYAVKGEERGYDPLACEASEDRRHSPDQPSCLVCAVTGPLHKRDRQRVKHAVAQIDHALTDSRIGGAAAAWLRTIRSGLTGSEDAT